MGAHAYTGVEVGEPEAIEPHDELSPNAGGHEELYVVLAGRARFVVGGEEIDAPRGTMLRVDVSNPSSPTETHSAGPRRTAQAPHCPPRRSSYWYAAEPAYLAGEYERGIEILSERMADHPESPGLTTSRRLHALAGHENEAVAPSFESLWVGQTSG